MGTRCYSHPATTQWDNFKVATNDRRLDLEEYIECIINYIDNYIGDVTMVIVLSLPLNAIKVLPEVLYQVCPASTPAT